MPSFEPSTCRTLPQDVGILDLEVYFPSQYVDQNKLETFDGVSQGKYTIGLGQLKMGFCSDREDINSVCLTVLSHLMERNKIGYDEIGRLEVGTETILDKSKSVKSVLMQLFEDSGNSDVEGIDTTNACYGGTAALINAINWVESSSWDGRYAIVIAADIAVYAAGSAGRPTGGAGAVAMLVGPNAPLIVESGLRSSHMRHSYDFYKPNLSSEYPTVDGKLSIECYLSALDACYQGYIKKASRAPLDNPVTLDNFDAFLFHAPYCKLVQKSFARLAFNDYLKMPRDQAIEKHPDLISLRERKLEETYFDRDVEKSFMTASKDAFDAKTKKSLLLASNVGNMYTSSLYSGLVSFLASDSVESLIGKRVGLFSYGSGLAATMFSIRTTEITGDFTLQKICDSLSTLNTRLEARHELSPEDFTAMMKTREDAYLKAPYVPIGDVNRLFPGTWYLTKIDDMYRREYQRVPSTQVPEHSSEVGVSRVTKETTQTPTAEGTAVVS